MNQRRKNWNRLAGASALPLRIRLQVWFLAVLWSTMVFSLVGGPFLPLVLGIAFGIDVKDYFDNVFGWQLAGTAVLVLGGWPLSGRLDRNIEEAKFVDGHRAIGRLVEVITKVPYDGESMGEYELVVSAEVPGPVTIRRRFRWSAYGDAPRLGETVRFRHNTVDPDDPDDILFDGLGATGRADTPGPDLTDFWLSQAKTRRTRARIRWWSWVEDAAVRGMFIGIVGAIAMVPVFIGLVVWIEYEYLPLILSGVWVVLAGLIPFCAWANGFASRRYGRAILADGRWSVGRIEDVVRLPPDAGDGATHDLTVIARLPGTVTLHRSIRWHDRQTPSPSPDWIGRRICFRHHNHVPDDLRDADFDGWPDGPP